jgi:GDP-4-dehydro-6-deoxy-D-mannose reductase
MRFVVLGGSSVSGQQFCATVRRFHPAADVVIFNRSDLDIVTDGMAVTALKNAFCRIFRKENPSHVINFLGSFSNEFEQDLVANVVVPQALLDAAVDSASQASILLIGSAAEYGKVANANVPVCELEPLAPVSVYGLTKMMQSLLVPFYAAHFSLDVKLARTFNILAPQLSPRLLVGRVFRQIEEIKAGSRMFIEVGALDDERDYISVERAVEDYLAVLTKGKSGEVYNVCSGQATKMIDIVQLMLADSGLLNINVKIDEASPRSSVPKIFGSRKKLDALRSQ